MIHIFKEYLIFKRTKKKHIATKNKALKLTARFTDKSKLLACGIDERLDKKIIDCEQRMHELSHKSIVLKLLVMVGF